MPKEFQQKGSVKYFDFWGEMRTIPIEKSSGTSICTCDPQNRTVSYYILYYIL